MTPVTAAKVKYGVWGLICGAIIAMIIGFAWGGWTTSGTTKTMGDEAVLAARRASCVSQSMRKVDEIAGLSLTPGMEPTPYSVRFPSERNLPTLPPSGARLAVQSQPKISTTQ